MDFKGRFYTTVEAIAPQSFPDFALRTFTNDIQRLLSSPYKTNPQMESLLYRYKNRLPDTQNNNILWERIEELVYPMLSMSSQHEMSDYLENYYMKLQEEILSPTGSQKRRNSEYLMKQNFDKYNQFQAPVAIPPSVYAESFETLDKFSDRRSILSSHYNNAGAFERNRETFPLKTISDPYYANTLPEADILKYVPYTLLGTTSDMFPIENGKIRIPYNIPNAESGTLHLIFEAGLIYMHLSQRIEYYKTFSMSPMKKSLLMKIEKELNNYTGYINSLNIPNRISSLKELYCKTYESILSLRIYQDYINVFEETRGDEYLNLFHSYKSHGDILIKEIAEELYDCLMSFYVDYIINWVTLGKLEATFNEFFLEEDETQPYIHISLQRSKIQEFIPKEIAYQTYIIGKTYIFLTKYCKELKWSNDFSKKYTVKYQNIAYKFKLANLLKIINEQYTEIITYSRNVLLNKFHFKEVVHMLKDILLMGKNDLIDMVMEKAKDALAAPSDSLTSYVSTKILQEAVQQSSFKNWINKADKNFLINNLDARVLDLGHGLLGWDVFTLEYIVHPPLAIVLNVNRSDGRKEYLRIFNFLWRFKRNDYFCNEEMSRTKELIRSFRKISTYNPLARDILTKLSKIAILRSQLQQFNTEIQSYYMRFIIDKNFNELELNLMLNEKKMKPGLVEKHTLNSGLIVLKEPLLPNNLAFDSDLTNRSTSLNNDKLDIQKIDEIHNSFLNNILSHKLFASSNVGSYSGLPYPTSLIVILLSISEFISSYSKLNEVAHSIFIQISLENNQPIDDMLNEFNNISNATVKSYKEFRKRSHIFRSDLRADSDEELKTLSKLLR